MKGNRARLSLPPALRTCQGHPEFLASVLRVLAQQRGILVDLDKSTSLNPRRRSTDPQVCRLRACVDRRAHGWLFLAVVALRGLKCGSPTKLFEDRPRWPMARSRAHGTIAMDPSNIQGPTTWASRGPGAAWREILCALRCLQFGIRPPRRARSRATPACAASEGREAGGRGAHPQELRPRQGALFHPAGHEDQMSAGPEPPNVGAHGEAARLAPNSGGPCRGGAHPGRSCSSSRPMMSTAARKIL